MKLRNLLLIIGLALAPLCMAGEIATFDKPTHGISLSLWHDHVEYVSNENVQMSSEQTETLDFDVSITKAEADWYWWAWFWAFVFATVVFLLTVKWAYLAIMLTEYENFVREMDAYYYTNLVENYNFPYHDCKASKFLYNFRVWTVRDALNKTLDVFSHHDFDLWRENNNYRPKIRY
jgi:hypothetical protein